MLVRIAVKKRTIFSPSSKLYFYIAICTILIISVAIGLSIKHISKVPSSDESPQLNADVVIRALKSVDCCFPVPSDFSYSYNDDFGSIRKILVKEHSHQGIDIMAKRGTPAIAIEDCIIDRIGWDTSGGNRINMVTADGKRRYYYAHFGKFASGLYQGAKIARGSVIGYIGSSGYGPPGSDTGTSPHLHIQMWVRNMNKEYLVNPYKVLKWLEENQKQQSLSFKYINKFVRK